MSKIEYKFNEEKLLQELQQYVDSTYDQHYATEKYQATDIIIDSGHGTGFCLGNVIKYAKRYGRKGTSEDARKDLMKILHYALIQLYVHDIDFPIKNREMIEKFHQKSKKTSKKSSWKSRAYPPKKTSIKSIAYDLTPPPTPV